MSDDLPDPDRIDGAPHPRETLGLFGQENAEAEFLEAYAGGRLHHAWMLTGPRGVGKATLAWRIARFLLANPPASGDDMFGAPPPPASLDVSPDHPVSRRMLAGSEPGLHVLRRGPNDAGTKLSADIRIDRVRALKGFFSLSATDGGRRIVIVDAADELNTSSANALLKVLEEPPKDAILILITHQPSRLLPTIRSRCRVLRLSPLDAPTLDAALAQAGVTPEPGLSALAAGSTGAAVRLANLGGLDLYRLLVQLFGGLPQVDRAAIAKLGDLAGARGGEARYDLLLDLFDLFLSRAARTGATGEAPIAACNGEASLLARMAPSPRAAQAWAQLQGELSARARHGRAVNLDPAALVLDMVLSIEAQARQVATP